LTLPETHTEVIKPESQKFWKTTHGDTIKIYWRSSFAFYLVIVILIIINVTVWGNYYFNNSVSGNMVKKVFLYSIPVIIFIWNYTRNFLILTPEYLSYYRGTSIFRRKIFHRDIRVVYSQSRMNTSDDPSADSDYVASVILPERQRVAIGGRLNETDAKFLVSEISKFNPNKVQSRYSHTNNILHSINEKPFRWTLLGANIIGTLAWWAPISTELGDWPVRTTGLPIFSMVMGWAMYAFAVWLCIKWNDDSKKKAVPAEVFSYSVVSIIVAFITFYVLFFVFKVKQY